MSRLFVALRLPPLQRATLEEALPACRFDAVRRVDPADWHLTLAFLGEVEGGEVEGGEVEGGEVEGGEVEGDRRRRVDEAVEVAVGGHAPFTLGLTGRFGHFGGRVLWAGLEQSPALDALARGVQHELRRRDVALPDRPFAAHLTVARSRGAGRGIRRLADDLGVPPLELAGAQGAPVRLRRGLRRLEGGREVRATRPCAPGLCRSPSHLRGLKNTRSVCSSTAARATSAALSQGAATVPPPRDPCTAADDEGADRGA